MRGMVAAFAAGALLGVTGMGPIALIAAGLMGVVLLWRSSTAREQELEMADELAGYDPHESIAEARKRIVRSSLDRAGE